MPIDRYFSYNIGLFVQDLQKKKFALASRPKEEQQDPNACLSSQIIKQTDRELRHAPKRGGGHP